MAFFLQNKIKNNRRLGVKMLLKYILLKIIIEN